MLLNILQGSEEWHSWRKGKIGASDSAAILGISPWQSAYEQWLLMSGRSKPKEASYAMLRGSAREEEARSDYEERIGFPMFPTCAVHDDYPWMSASLDGLSMDEKRGLEIKWPNKKVMDLAREGKVPDYYMAQIQHQMAVVPTIESIDYLACSDNDQIIINVKRDPEYIKTLIKTLEKFYVEHFLADLPPEMSEQDCMIIEEDADFARCARNWLQAKQALDIAKEEESEARRELLDCTDDGSCLGYGVKIKKFYETRVDYKKACEKEGIDLSKYKKETTVKWRISEHNGD